MDCTWDELQIRRFIIEFGDPFSFTDTQIALVEQLAECVWNEAFRRGQQHRSREIQNLIGDTL